LAQAMKYLVKQYLDEGISRRQFLSGLSALGMSTIAARTMAESLTPFASSAQTASAPGARPEVTGSGGALFVQQLEAAGVEYVFFNPATGDAPIFDAMIDEPQIHLIKGMQEGAVAAMADGYARLSGKPGVAIVAAIGLPNAMTQMVNTFKDRIPVLVVVAPVGQEMLGREHPQYYDHQDSTLGPITKWRWTAQSTREIPEMTRRALKFAATPPSGPVFLSIPDEQLRTRATSTIMDMALDAPMPIRPDNVTIEKAARMLIEAKNPLLAVGDEVTLCRGEKEVVQLAELLGLPVAGQNEFGIWSKPFPTRHPLYLGPTLRAMRFPGQVDVYINIGNRYAEFAANDAKRISIRQDPIDHARIEPAHLRIVADVKLATADLIEAIKSMATESRLKQIATRRASRIHEYTKQMADLRKAMVGPVGNGSAIRCERLAMELENGLEKDTIYVTDCDSGKAMNPFMSFGGADKTYIGNGPGVLGWGVAASVGVKLACPDRPVVAILGDGAMMFGGPQPLWSMARYSAPITTIVYNNRSYNNERNRIWGYLGGAQFKQGRDMTCYNGDPDVDFAKAAQAFGVEGETVKESSQIKDALGRAKRANIDGRPYLLDVQVERVGIGAASTWHPGYSIADKRTRKV
jgi:thiamine pyrophosphate-dependent acetolactate synthase large subunit-like protein